MASFSLLFSAAAAGHLEQLERDRGLAKRLRAVRKTLARLETDPRHPGLQSHEFKSLSDRQGVNGVIGVVLGLWYFPMKKAARVTRKPGKARAGVSAPGGSTVGLMGRSP